LHLFPDCNFVIDQQHFHLFSTKVNPKNYLLMLSTVHNYNFPKITLQVLSCQLFMFDEPAPFPGVSVEPDFRPPGRAMLPRQPFRVGVGVGGQSLKIAAPAHIR